MTTEVVVREGRLAGIPARRIDVRCAHGVSRTFLVPGRDPARNAAALEVLRIRHVDRFGCGCRDADLGLRRH